MSCVHEWEDTPFAGGQHCPKCLTVRGKPGEAITWSTGNWSSYPSDGRAYLEATEAVKGADVVKVWHVYQTGEDGALLEGFPLVTSRKFFTLSEAQQWVIDNVDPR